MLPKACIQSIIADLSRTEPWEEHDDCGSNSRSISETDYVSGNLLKQEVTADHVAAAFLTMVMAECTTVGVLTVDGGNIEVALW